MASAIPVSGCGLERNDLGSIRAKLTQAGVFGLAGSGSARDVNHPDDRAPMPIQTATFATSLGRKCPDFANQPIISGQLFDTIKSIAVIFPVFLRA
jgi:hypothetical protein